MREVHGVVAGVSGGAQDARQHVRITDGDDCIFLNHTATGSAILNAEEARFLAKQLVLAAGRLEAKKK